MRITTILTLLVCLTGTFASAQEQSGLRLDNYSGVNSLLINPAANLSSKIKWDINLVSFGFFTETNYGFIGNTRLSTLLKNQEQVFLATDFEDPSEITGDMLIFDYYDNSRKKHALFSTIVSGPGFMVNLDGRHSFGLFTQGRIMASAQKLPETLSYYHFDRTPYGERIIVAPFSLAAMAWTEIGINYAFASPMSSGKLGLGISLKYLNGYESFYLKNDVSAEIAQITDDSLHIFNTGFEYGLTTSNTDGSYNGLSKNGNGWAIDLGATFVINEHEEGYSWKLGVSLLDIGRIKFSKNAVQHQLNLDTPTIVDLRDYGQYSNVTGYMEMLSQQLLNDPAASLTDRQFDLWLPGAISVQADYSVSSDFYVHGLLVQRLPLSSQLNIIQRANLLTFAPRFEKRWFGASLPFFLYNWQDFRIGTSIRLGFLTIGTDHLGSILRKTDFSGTDFYLALKLNPFELKKGRSGSGRKTIRGKNVKCYKF